MHSDRTPVSVAFTRFALLGAALALAGCGNTYRPVVSSINPVGPAGQPQKYAVAVSSNGANTNGLVTIIDFSGDTILDTTALGINPQYFILDTSGGIGYTTNGDGTLNSFQVSTGLIGSNIAQTTLLANSSPISLTSQGANLYVAQGGRQSIAQLAGGEPPTLRSELPTGAGTFYTVSAANAPRAYTIVQGAGGAPGQVTAIETGTNTLSATIPVGVQPVYGIMTPDARRAFILNKGSNTISVINSQTNAPDTFHVGATVTGTIPTGVAPVWADFAPTLAEMVVANAGNGTTPGSVTIVSIPLCNATTVTSNPNCDTANPVDASGFGTVVANIPVGINPVMVAVLQDGTQAYVANAGNATTPGSVSVINLITNTVIATVPAVNSSTNESDAFIHGHPAWIAATTGTPTGKVYVTALDSTDITIIRTDIDAVQTHLSLQGNGVAVRMTAP